MRKSKILFQLSGSIACFKACALLSMLVKEGHEIEVVATASALKFVGEATLEGLTGRRVHTSTFAAGGYMDHIRLQRWADVILLSPASANTLNKMAQGIGDDLVTTLFLAHDFKKPYLVVPAMNQAMYAHPATQASLKTLSTWGVTVLATGSGTLACGENGEGRMLEADEIYRALTAAVAPSRGKILITAGGTQEPIDGVRAITNTSTGRTGASLANWFSANGYDVTLLRAETAARPSATVREETFTTFASLAEKLKHELSANGFDSVIHLAAVADYSLAEVESNGVVRPAPLKSKIDSGEDLTLRLKKNPKLVDSIRAWSKNPQIKVVAFKLTNTSSVDEQLSAITSLASHASPDIIVHNDLRTVSSSEHPFSIYEISQGKVAGLQSRATSAETLAERLSGVEL